MNTKRIHTWYKIIKVCSKIINNVLNLPISDTLPLLSEPILRR